MSVPATMSMVPGQETPRGAQSMEASEARGPKGRHISSPGRRIQTVSSCSLSREWFFASP
eukprot:9489423-Pyramimonas_sp.AAC.1